MQWDRRKLDRDRRFHSLEYQVLATLSDGPRTPAEIHDYFVSFGRRFGLFVWEGPSGYSQEKLAQSLLELCQCGWIEPEGERYRLTGPGQIEMSKFLEHMRGARQRLDKIRQALLGLLRPESVSKVSLAVYIALTLIKLPAGLLSGSVGLINDSFDTLLDGLCSLLVFLGFRFKRERLVNIVQVIMMLGGGSLTLYQAVSGLSKTYEPEVNLFTFAAALLSGLACAGLYFYQRYAGLKNGSFGLITQSVDSRNHILVAGGVTVGLVAALLKFGLLDALVGLVVAGLILKSAVEMAIELLHSLNSAEPIDLSNYRLGFKPYEDFQRGQLGDWMLLLIQEGKVRDLAELTARVESGLQFSRHPVLRELGWDQAGSLVDLIRPAIQALFEQGWIVAEPPLELTPAGKEHLAQQTRRYDRRKQRSTGHRYP